MPDIPDTIADTMSWKALPVPGGDVHLICQVQPIRVTFKEDRTATAGLTLKPGDMIRLKSGDTGFIRPVTALGGIAVFEDFG